jgi:putative colanic acid biosynthesis acetyltransferase WcaF
MALPLFINLNSLGEIELGARCTIAQEAYLCTGTHDLTQPTFPLVVAKITVGEDAFVGARVFILPGVRIGARAIVGACSVVTNDVPDEMIAAGNPCKVLRVRPPLSTGSTEEAPDA